jgi:polyketide cyclase/dehydrase/lipid transport protein
MLPVELHVHISAPREEIYDVISDLGLRVAWCDNYQSQYRLAWPNSKGEGAGARYLLRAPSWRNWMETMVVEADRPRRIVERTHGGRAGRSKGGIVWELESLGSGLTRVELTIWSEAGTLRERFKEKLGFRRWLRRGAKGSLERLRMIFEEHPDRPLARATVAAFEPLKAPRFGMHPHRAVSRPRG